MHVIVDDKNVDICTVCLLINAFIPCLCVTLCYVSMCIMCYAIDICVHLA